MSSGRPGVSTIEMLDSTEEAHTKRMSLFALIRLFFGSHIDGRVPNHDPPYARTAAHTATEAITSPNTPRRRSPMLVRRDVFFTSVPEIARRK